MTLKDSRGVPLSTGDLSSVERYEEAASLFLRFSTKAMDAIDDAIAADPGFVMGHCLKLGLIAIANEKAFEPQLRAALEAAEALESHANARERGHIAGARAWLAGDLNRALRIYSDILIDHPRDTVALQLAHALDFYLGQSNMLRDRIARVLPFWSEATPGYGFVLGMHAFGLEETGDYARAETMGRRAVELDRHDAWAIHAVAHVLEMQGRAREGVWWLERRADDWSAPDNLFAIHNWWHLALFHLDLGDHDRVLKLYDERIRAGRSTAGLDMVDASAMLWRLHLRGVDVGDRWQEVADCWEATVDDGWYAFNDVHAVMAFVADGREAAAKRQIATLQQRSLGVGDLPTNTMMSRDVGLPVARAIVAFGRGDYATAVDVLRGARHVANRFGGSHAQRDILSLTLIEAALRGGDGKLARALAAERTALKPSSPFNWQLTERAQRLLGQAERADDAGAWSRVVAATA